MTPGFLRQPPASPAPEKAESLAERTARIDREADAIAKGHADIDAGFGIEDDELEAWLDSLDSDENAPLPTQGRTPPRR